MLCSIQILIMKHWGYKTFLRTAVILTIHDNDLLRCNHFRAPYQQWSLVQSIGRSEKNTSSGDMLLGYSSNRMFIYDSLVNWFQLKRAISFALAFSIML